MLGGLSFGSPCRLDRALSDFAGVVVWCLLYVVVVMLWVEWKPLGSFVVLWATVIGNPAEREYQ